MKYFSGALGDRQDAQRRVSTAVYNLFQWKQPPMLVSPLSSHSAELLVLFLLLFSRYSLFVPIFLNPLLRERTHPSPLVVCREIVIVSTRRKPSRPTVERPFSYLHHLHVPVCVEACKRPLPAAFTSQNSLSSGLPASFSFFPPLLSLR